MSDVKPLNESQDVPVTIAQDAWDVPQSRLTNFGRVPPEKQTSVISEVIRQNAINAQIMAMMAKPRDGHS